MMAALSAIALTAFVVWRLIEPQPLARVGQTQSTAVTPTVQIGGPFTLTDQSGKRVASAEFKDDLRLIYFGYGYCPDVCPTELQNMAAALDELGAQAKKIQPIFITVDPERDNVEFMASYVPNFHPRLVGMTGTRAQIDEVAKAYRVYHAKVNSESASDYLMDHSTFVYLMGSQDQFLTMFRGNTAPDKMAAAISKYLGSSN